MNLLKTLVVGVALLAIPSAAQDFDCWYEDYASGEEHCDVEIPENQNTPDDTDIGSDVDPDDPGDFTADPSSGDDYKELGDQERAELIQTYRPPDPTDDLDGTGFGADTDDEYWEEVEYDSCVDDAGELHTESTASCAGADDYDACTESVDDSYSYDVSSCNG